MPQARFPPTLRIGKAVKRDCGQRSPYPRAPRASSIILAPVAMALIHGQVDAIQRGSFVMRRDQRTGLSTSFPLCTVAT
jgi:hypothetical protein